VAVWSTVFAAIAAIAAAVSLVFAWMTVGLGREAQKQYEQDRQRAERDRQQAERDRRLQRMERIAEGVTRVIWAAHGPAHEWVEPRDRLAIVLAGTTDSLDKCRDVIAAKTPTSSDDEAACLKMAAEAERCARLAQDEVNARLKDLEAANPR
jgi:K+-sensing histidine kinase KdpD